jgi:AraC-like DNA-binding protein
LSEDAGLFRDLGNWWPLPGAGHGHCWASRRRPLQRSCIPACTVTSTRSSNGAARVADYIDDQYASDLRLEDICAASSLSASYLIRAFRQRYHMTPHEYLLDRRIRRGKALLRSGQSIAQVAQTLGFAAQAHFQRTFKRLVAATPGQYSRSSGGIPAAQRAASPVGQQAIEHACAAAEILLQTPAPSQAMTDSR